MTLPLPRLTAWRTLDAARRHRRLLVLDAPAALGRRLAADLLADAQGEDRLWIGPQPPPGIDTQPSPGIEFLDSGAFTRLLGREWDLLVLDAHPGLDPDALAAAVGAVRAGGLLVLAAPLSHTWVGGPSVFLQRLARLFVDDPEVLRIGDSAHLPPPPPAPPAKAAALPTPDQARAVDALLHLARGHPHRPLVLIADRGRGKTSAFGLAAVRLLAAGKRVILTAPRLAAVEPALVRTAEGLPGARRERGRVSQGEGLLEYAPADALVRQPRHPDLLLVDEAAALPAPLLEALVRTHPRLAFATTVGGYEGSGRGFEVRFQRRLNRLAPGWRRLELHTPVRWAEGDPLERAARRWFLWGRELPPAPGDSHAIQRLEPQVLAQDETALTGIFRLLILAHYQTRPHDLAALLDDLRQYLFCMGPPGAPAALAWVREEGGLDPGLEGDILWGRRRIQGHLLPQTLAQHLGLGEALAYRGWRVSRLLVHPEWQGRGLGSRLLTALGQTAKGSDQDWIGTAFGLTHALLAFWRRNGFLLVRCGLHRDKSSGEHSVVMLKPLGKRGASLAESARARFFRHLPLQLAGPLRDLDPLLGAELLRGCPVPPLDPADRADLEALAEGHRLPEATPGGLRDLAQRLLSAPPPWLDDSGRRLLTAQLFQQRDWKTCAGLLGLRGRRQAVARLRRIVSNALRAEVISE